MVIACQRRDNLHDDLSTTVVVSGLQAFPTVGLVMADLPCQTFRSPLGWERRHPPAVTGLTSGLRGSGWGSGKLDPICRILDYKIITHRQTCFSSAKTPAPALFWK